MKSENKIIRRVGNHIRQLREAKGLSQEQLALEAGVDNSHLGKLERGQGNPTLKLVTRVAEALGVETDYLVGAMRYGQVGSLRSGGIQAGNLVIEENYAAASTKEKSLMLAEAQRLQSELTKQSEEIKQQLIILKKSITKLRQS